LQLFAAKLHARQSISKDVFNVTNVCNSVLFKLALKAAEVRKLLNVRYLLKTLCGEMFSEIDMMPVSLLRNVFRLSLIKLKGVQFLGYKMNFNGRSFSPQT